MNEQQRTTVDGHPVGQYPVKRHPASSCMGAVYEVVHDSPSRFRRAASMPACLLLLFSLAALWGCGREPGIIVNIAAWPDGAERIRLRTTIEGTVGTDIFLDKNQTRFAVRVPVSSQGVVQIDAAALDAVDCKLATGSLSEPVPENLSRFIELTLELLPLPARECIFGSVTQFPVGMSPISVAVGDFNGDLKSDLAVANYNGSSVSLLLGDRLVGFGGATTFQAVASPFSVAVGDFNGDTKPDLAIVSYTNNTVIVLLRNSLGTFDEPDPLKTFLVGTKPASVAVGDFNGDLKPDLAVANFGSNDVTVLLGDGLGGFPRAMNFPVGMQPFSVAVGDFNGDLKPDLVVANSGSNNVSVLLGLGQGLFDMAKPSPVGMTPRSVAVGDFNGDMQPDLVVANDMADSVSVLLGGNIGARANLSVGKNPQSVVVGDFNGDRKPDLAVANYFDNNVSVLLGNGQGSFGVATSFFVGQGPQSVAVGDFNGDLKPDLAVANQTSNDVSLLLNQF